MHLLRRLCALGVAVLAACAVAVPAATASSSLHVGSTTGPLSSAMSGVQRSAVTLTGAFPTITCPGSTFKGADNGSGSPSVNGSLDASGGLVLVACHSPTNAPCTATIAPVPLPDWVVANTFGLGVNGTFDWSLPSGYLTLSGVGCLPGNATCSFGGSVISGAWTSATALADATTTFTNEAIAGTGGACPTTANWSASYNVRDTRTFSTGAKLYLEGF